MRALFGLSPNTLRSKASEFGLKVADFSSASMDPEVSEILQAQYYNHSSSSRSKPEPLQNSSSISSVSKSPSTSRASSGANRIGKKEILDTLNKSETWQEFEDSIMQSYGVSRRSLCNRASALGISQDSFEKEKLSDPYAKKYQSSGRRSTSDKGK